MVELRRWNDDRLDDLHAQVRRMQTTVDSVGRLDERIKALTDAFPRLERGVEDLTTRLEEMGSAPLRRARAFRDQLVVGALAAGLGGLVVFIISRFAG